MATKPLGTVNAHPVKSFFVHMLTRDISLQDAILDLLDNCVDGVQRSETKKTLDSQNPYKGYFAKISISKDSFKIEDNCGGIPWASHDYAFRLGRLNDEVQAGRRTVGTYGIGMKRAIFKIGRSCDVVTHSKDKSYKVTISPQWMKAESEWDLPAVAINQSNTLGTTINISKVNEGVGITFATKQFENALREDVATHYAYIIAKGFRVYINDDLVTPKTIHLLFAKGGPSRGVIRPFIYKANSGGVDVLMAVGFTAPIPSKEEADEDLENYQEKHSSMSAGWTIICNDRTVLYCDKTPLTGWGLSGVPQYHTQFTAISGVVMFSSDHASKLPTTTTKRGIDASSTLYLLVRDKMIEGMKIFTQYTYRWKSKELAAQSRESFRSVAKADMETIRKQARDLPLSDTRGVLPGKQYKPELPRPKNLSTIARIAFDRPIAQIKKVSSYLYGIPDKDAKIIGEKCFDTVLEEASQ